MIKENFYTIAREEIFPKPYAYNPNDNSVVESKIDFNCLNVFGHTASLINETCVVILFGIYSEAAILNDKDDILKLLLDLRANTNFVDEKGRNLIHTTIFKDKEKYIKIISQYNNTIINQADSFGAKPINYAAFMGKKSVVLELIDLGASINNGNKKSPNILEH